jgi:hypothetical protein
LGFIVALRRVVIFFEIQSHIASADAVRTQGVRQFGSKVQKICTGGGRATRVFDRRRAGQAAISQYILLSCAALQTC